MEVTIQIVPGDMCRIIAASGAALRLPLDRGLNAFFMSSLIAKSFSKGWRGAKSGGKMGLERF